MPKNIYTLLLPTSACIWHHDEPSVLSVFSSSGRWLSDWSLLAWSDSQLCTTGRELLQSADHQECVRCSRRDRTTEVCKRREKSFLAPKQNSGKKCLFVLLLRWLNCETAVVYSLHMCDMWLKHPVLTWIERQSYIRCTGKILLQHKDTFATIHVMPGGQYAEARLQPEPTFRCPTHMLSGSLMGWRPGRNGTCMGSKITMP